jgi:outer membrane protein
MVFFLALCVAPLSAVAQERDLLELFQLAKGKDPQLARAGARLEAARADKDIAWAAIFPRITANASIKQFWFHADNYNSQTLDGVYTGYSYGIGGTLNFFNLPSYYQISVANAGIESSDYSIQATRQDLIVRLLTAYLGYLKAMADEKLYKDELSRMGKVHEQAQAFLSAGTGDIIAVYEAKARMDSAAADLVKAEAQRKMAQQQLSSLTGVTVDAIKDIAVGNPTGPQPAELEWWIDTMWQRNPSLLQARKDLQQAEANSKATVAGHYPTIQGYGGYTDDKGSTFHPKLETRQWYGGIGLNVTLYSGGETSARTQRARAGETERRAMLDDVQDQGIKRLKESYLNLKYNQSLVEAYRRKHESAELQLKAVQKGRSIGTRTAIDVLNAEQTFSVSQRDLAAALYDNMQRRLELKAAAGILAESDLMELVRY